MIMAFFIRVSAVNVSVVCGGKLAAGTPPRELSATCVLNVNVLAPPVQEELGHDPSCVSYSEGGSSVEVVTTLVWSVTNEI